MLHYAAFHLGLHCLSKYPFRGFQCTKDKIRFYWNIGGKSVCSSYQASRYESVIVNYFSYFSAKTNVVGTLLSTQTIIFMFKLMGKKRITILCSKIMLRNKDPVYKI